MHKKIRLKLQAEHGAVDETRTRDLHLGKVALYQLSYYRRHFGAGDGNRTHVASLEGWNSTIELHPRNGAVDETRTRDLHLGKVALYQLSYYRKTGLLYHIRRAKASTFWKLVRAKRLELIRLGHQILNLARLPFRHARTPIQPAWRFGSRFPNQDAFLLYSTVPRLSRRQRPLKCFFYMFPAEFG